MAQYRLLKNYANRTMGPWLAGAVVDLAPEDAQRIEANTPGTLRLIEAPQHDRMIRKPMGKRAEE